MAEATPFVLDAAAIALAANTLEYQPYYSAEEKTPTRLDRAQKLVSEDRVHFLGNAEWDVDGAGQTYQVTLDGCSCPASRHGKTKWCYHMVACKLWDRAQEMADNGHVSVFHGPKPSVEETMPTDMPEWPEDGSPIVGEVGDEVMPPAAGPFPGVAEMPTKKVEQAAPKTTDVATPHETGPWMDAFMRAPLRPISAIVADLSRPLPDDCVATRTQDGQTIRYLHWWDIRMLLDAYAPGWTGEIVRTEEFTRDELASKRSGEVKALHTAVVTYRLTIPCAEGCIIREAIGRETAESVPFGDWTSNASAMAFTRAAAMFGVGTWLREKDGTSSALQMHLLKEAWASLGHGKTAAEREAIAETLLARARVAQRKDVPLWMVRGETGETL